LTRDVSLYLNEEAHASDRSIVVGEGEELSDAQPAPATNSAAAGNVLLAFMIVSGFALLL